MTVNETTSKSNRRTTTKRTRAEQAEQQAADKTPALDPSVTTALQAASDKKALAPVVLDLRELSSFTDCFLITSGTNQRQVQAIADEIEARLKQEGTRPARIEGYKTAEWVLLDYGDFVVHVFDDKARRFYDLERLWRDAVRVELPPELRGEADSSLRHES
ncbi:MAG: ribosome silencing factor [Acidobacteria bacterium]|nr:MAG: ribosome silencing factor [Acidobacteriota bacterium]